MGGEVTVASAPRLRIRVDGAAPLDRVQIIRGDRLAHTAELSPSMTGGEAVWNAELTWQDARPLRGETLYYVRVTQCDNHFGWTSPIWVTCPEGIATDEDALPPWNDDVWPPVSRGQGNYLPAIRACLGQQRCGDRFVDLEQVGVFEETRGRYVLVRCRDAARGHRPAHLHYYLGFEDERLYVSAGWTDYGPVSNE